MAESKQVVEKILIKDLEIDLDTLPPEIDPELGINDTFNGSFYNNVTILGYAIHNCHNRLPLFKAILKTINKKNGCNVNKFSFHYSTPLEQCLSGKSGDYIDTLIEMVSDLINANASLTNSIPYGSGKSELPLDCILKRYPNFRHLLQKEDFIIIPKYLKIEKLVLSAMIPSIIKNVFEFIQNNNMLPLSLNTIIMEYFVEENFGKKFIDETTYPAEIQESFKTNKFHNNLFKLVLLYYKEKNYKELIEVEIKNKTDNAKVKADSTKLEQQYYNQLHHEKNSSLFTEIWNFFNIFNTDDLQNSTGNSSSLVQSKNFKTQEANSQIQNLEKTVSSQAETIKKLETQILFLNKQMKNIVKLFEQKTDDNIKSSSNNSSDNKVLSLATKNNLNQTEKNEPNQLLIQFDRDISQISQELSQFEKEHSLEQDNIVPENLYENFQFRCVIF